MGKELAEAESAAARVFAEADDVLGIPLSRIAWEGPERDLNDTLNTQPALLVHSIAVLRVFQQRLPEFQPAYCAGHSLGEISALVAAGSIPFPDAVRLVRERGAAMQAAGERSPGGMAAVLGMDAPDVARICVEVSAQGSGGVWVANDNCPGQIVISGDVAGLEAATEQLQAAGARKVVRLAVSIAAHSPLMAAAETHFQRALDQTPFSDPQIPIIGNVEVSQLRNAAEVRADLKAQLTANVRWTETISTMLNAGVTTFVELGSGSVLCGLVRRIDRAAASIPLDSPASFEALSI